MKQDSARMPRVAKTARQLLEEAAQLFREGLNAPVPTRVGNSTVQREEAEQLRKQFELKPSRGRNSIQDLLPKADAIAKAYVDELKSFRDLAAAYNCTLPTIQAILATKRVPIRPPGRVFGKENDGGEQQSKITAKQREWLLDQDKAGTKRSVIAEVLGVSRQRVQQLCERAGHESVRARGRQAREHRELRKVQTREMRRVQAATQPPSAEIVSASTLWQMGRSITDIAQVLGRNPNGLGVEIARWRRRWPALFARRYQKHTFKA